MNKTPVQYCLGGGTRGSVFGLAAALLLVLGTGTLARAQTDLAPLFATPTAPEIQAVRDDWQMRDRTPGTWTVVDESMANGHRIQLVRYELGSLGLYAMLRFPRDETLVSWPVLMWNHGGLFGMTADEVLGFDADHPSTCLADSFLVAAPTYRAEAFRGGAGLPVVISDGEPSPFDYDADDALALLDAVLSHVPRADPTRIVQWGRSRGSNVVWHVALRDARIKRSTAYFAPTDFRRPEIQAECQQAADTGVPPTGEPASLVMSYIAEPWLAGSITLAEARHKLLAWSPVPFLTAPLAIQIHHGESDNLVPVAHGQEAAAALIAAGAVGPDFAAYFYPGGGHYISELTGHAPRTEAYLCADLSVSAATPGVTGSILRVWPNPTRGRVRFALSGAGIAAVPYEVFDAAGRRVGRFVLTPDVPTGWTARDRNGRALPSGVYLTRPVTGDVPAQRFLLIR